MKKSKIVYTLPLVVLLSFSCAPSKQTVREPNTDMPNIFVQGSADTLTAPEIQWKDYFKDEYLIALIDKALKNNQELNIVLQEIKIHKNEVLARSGEYLPTVDIGVGAGLEKEGLYTRTGAVDEQLTIKDEKPFPKPLGDFMLGATASWEVDVWRKLHNAKDAAAMQYLASIEGKNFLVTQLVAEVAENYYELLALDNLLQTVNENIAIQSRALNSVKLQKESAKATQLAVNRFEAQLLKTKNLQYEINQKIVEAENHLNFLTASFPSHIPRVSNNFIGISVDSLEAGIPSQLLAKRPDVKQAELGLSATKLDVKVARANFYPSLSIRSGLGYNAFNPSFLLNPQSLFYNLAGDLVAPLVNRKAIKATYFSANAKQLQAVYNYEQAILNAFIDVQNQLAKIDNYSASFAVKKDEVGILSQSVNIANSLFNSARADYVEVLLTQEEVLEAKMELIETKAKILKGRVNLYRALGGGWK